MVTVGAHWVRRTCRPPARPAVGKVPCTARGFLCVFYGAVQLASLPASGTICWVTDTDSGAPILAPWLSRPELWSIREVPALEVRPGMFCFVPSLQEFVEVTSCTLMGSQTPVVFIDLANAKTLQFPTQDLVYARIRV